MSNVAKYSHNRKDLSGRVFGRLIAIYYTHTNSDNRACWACVCRCGNYINVPGHSLTMGNTQSCGCYQRDQIKKYSTKHGDTKIISWSKEYRAWKGIRARCGISSRKINPDYNGRGITMCDRWIDSYDNFLSDMGRAPSKFHSIERSDVNGNYEPSNCKWATRIQQANNTRRNRILELDGVSKTLAQWCREYNAKYSRVQHRISRGWSIEMALTKPSRFTVS